MIDDSCIVDIRQIARPIIALLLYFAASSKLYVISTR